MRLSRAAFLLLLPVLGMILFLGTGVFALIEQSFVGADGLSLKAFQAFVSRREAMSVFLYTHQMALLVSAICVVVSFPLAVFLVRKQNQAYVLLIMMPLLVSIVVRTYGWMVILGPRGLINAALMGAGITTAPIRLMFNTTGVVIGLVHIYIPFATLSILTVYSKIDRSLVDGAAALGAGPWRVFSRIVLPLAMPGVIAAASIVYLLTIGAVVTPLLLGSIQQMMLGSMIYDQMLVTFDFPSAGSAAIILTLSAALAILPLQLADRWVTRKLPAERS